MDILTWRNDALSRKMSGSVDLIKVSDHLDWFKKALENSHILMLMAFDEQMEAKIGMIRFNFVSSFESAEISININPEYRGKGYGKACLINASVYISNAYSACRYIDARVRVENSPSIKAFLSAGYQEVSCEDSFFLYRLDI